MRRRAVVARARARYGWRRGWTRGGGRQRGPDKKSMPCNYGTARGGIGRSKEGGERAARRETLLMRQRRRHVRGTRKGGRRGVLQRAGETTVSRLALRSCPALRRQRATDLTVGGLAAARGCGHAGARLWAMKSVVLCISYYRLFALWPTTDAREYFEGIVIDLTIEQLYNRGARRKSRRISAPSASRTRTGRRGGRARLSGPRPEYVVGHKLAALPRLCTRASRHVHHLLFFCARTAFGSGCRPIHHPSKGRVQSVESPNLANSPRRHDRGSLD